MRKILKVLLALGLILGISIGTGFAMGIIPMSAALAQIIPQGLEFQVNTYTLNHQHEPSIAMDASGNFVIAWESEGQDGSNYGVYAQRYDASGTPLGSEFQVNTYITSHQTKPAIAMDASGFVITWESFGQDGNWFGVYAQRYDATGTPLGSEFQVNTYTLNHQEQPSIAMDASGFVIAWRSYGQDGDIWGVYAQRYDATGTPLGSEFQVNTYIASWQHESSIAMDASGNFVITWASHGQISSAWEVYAQMYDNTGTPVGGEFRVSTYTYGSQKKPAIAMDASGFVITWESSPQDGSGYGVYAQMYDNTGAPVGGEFRVNSYTTGAQGHPSIAMNASGNFVIAWDSWGQDGDLWGVYAQRYSPSSPAEAIANLIADVENLINTGVLNQSEGKGLIAKLNEALKNLNKAKPNERVVCNKLSDFIDQVNAYIYSGILTPIQGQALIDTANEVIDEVCEE